MGAGRDGRTWYAVQVHQTRYLVEIGFSATDAAWALGAVSLVAIPGQIALGHLSDRIGREWVWTVGNLGFVLCCPIPAEIFQGPNYGTILGALMLAAIAGGAAGPWVTGALHDATGSYVLAFWIAIGSSALSAPAIWLAAPREVRAVAGRVHGMT